VASEFLRKFGCNVIIASNGYEAINIIDNSFDIVLMDLQMPGIDGFETTKRIRKIYPNLPIIAMTAAVMQKDIEQCNNAGMNGHISKPFEISDMLATISKWIPDKIINDKVAIIESDTKLHIDYLDTDYAMKLFKDKDFYISILKKFEKTYKDKAEIIQNMLFNNDIKTAKEELHTLKGVSGNIGATELNKICSALEKSISVDSDLMVLKNELHLICSEISKIEVKQNNQYNSFDKEKALLVIDKFIFDIAESNIISKDDIDNFKNTLGDYADDELFSSFFNAIDSFDYSDASILLIQIKNIISK
jgi:CheY-like chemotaxis protein/HPt (histidine-containing phosphotransfer) domain-containing protein